MCRMPDGYGSISSWYQWRSSPAAPGSGFATWKACASSQTRCHFASIVFASYLSVSLTSRSRDEKASRERGRREPPRLVAACVSLLYLSSSFTRLTLASSTAQQQRPQPANARRVEHLVAAQLERVPRRLELPGVGRDGEDVARAPDEGQHGRVLGPGGIREPLHRVTQMLL